MRKRIDLTPELSPVPMPRRVLNELCAHALDAQLEECCGLVTGVDGDPYRTVYRCRNNMTMLHRQDPAAYPRSGQEAYYMSELDYLAAQQDSKERGEVVTAVYHSHVGAGAYFSELDQEFAEHALFPFPAADQIVMAVWDRHVAQVGLFAPDAETGELVGRPVEAEAP
jgi:proteasome lid subunit RPN8/RPN11